jgi:hypothetical protein
VEAAERYGIFKMKPLPAMPGTGQGSIEEKFDRFVAESKDLWTVKSQEFKQFSGLDKFDTSTAVSTSVDDNILLNTYNSLGQLIGASSKNTTIQNVKNADGSVVTSTVNTENRYVVLLGQARLLESFSLSTTRTDNSLTTTPNRVRYEYNDMGQLIGAHTVHKDGEKGLRITYNADGTETKTEIVVDNNYAILNGRAVVAKSTTQSTTTAGADTTVNVEETTYGYNENGQLSSASGRTISSRTESRVKDAHGSEKIVVTVNDPAHVSTTVFAVVWGQAVAVRTDSWQITYSGYDGSDLAHSAVETHTHSVTENQYNSLGQLIHTTGRSDGFTITRYADSTPDRSVARESRQDFSSENVYMIRAGQALIVDSVTNSRLVMGATTTTSTSNTHYNYNSRNQLISASGGSTSDTTQENSDTSLQISHSDTTSTYVVRYGKAVVSDSVTTSNSRVDTRTAADRAAGVPEAGNDINVTTSTSEIHFAVNELGQVTGATGSSESETTSRVFTDKNRNGKIDAGEEIDVPSSSSTTNVYDMRWGQAVLIHTETTSSNALAATDSSTTSKIDYRYNSKGQLVSRTDASDAWMPLMVAAVSFTTLV